MITVRILWVVLTCYCKAFPEGIHDIKRNIEINAKGREVFSFELKEDLDYPIFSEDL